MSKKWQIQLTNNEVGKALARAWNQDLKKLAGQTVISAPCPDPISFLRDWRTQIYDPSTGGAKDLALMQRGISVQAWVLPYTILDLVPPEGIHRFRRTSERPNLAEVFLTNQQPNRNGRIYPMDLGYTAALDGGGWLLLITGRGADKSPTSEELLEGRDEVILVLRYVGHAAQGEPDGKLALGEKTNFGYSLYAAEARFPTGSEVMELLLCEEELSFE